MEITGSYLLPCSPDTAWKALNDPEVLKACLKGCESLEKTGETAFSGKVAAKIGPVSARFSGTMRQTEIDAPHSCRMQFEGQGGVAGFAKGGALVTLASRDGGTELTYVADTQIGGRLAQMGARLVEGTAKSMADDFFGKFAAAVSAMEPAVGAPAEPPVSPPAPTGQPSSQRSLLVPSLIAAVIVALAIILLR
ncbi:carbon monoxide dehydrogenase subunit G [Novosphingobium sp. ERN07]|uniref:CoxG family protein n=1 Tax=unclassified Novosphingobium TaxID=2644732 RepID=UPI00061CA575|nr:MULTISPECIES: carbon monoxide dehydrogenase subunit G [unclassified Novosphingobium]AXU20903.1 carbon monoxide dehydrogenase [Novosphingobium sp. THN1]NLR41632.1 carbon monoxide dehydrogenase subunit G [Novosphingobium sp. ERW19]NLR73276.1 carbon monoxide dehydrogenase subunit G [Novosphingobium sp. ERN07]GAO56802.1 carbon monoxide dehydrogenase G protein [Novosphingobium sp. MD-1]